MTRSYKGYKIETVLRVELGLWKAWAKITPSRQEFGEMAKGGCLTREEAESEVWKLAKEKIDQVTS